MKMIQDAPPPHTHQQLRSECLIQTQKSEHVTLQISLDNDMRRIDNGAGCSCRKIGHTEQDGAMLAISLSRVLIPGQNFSV